MQQGANFGQMLMSAGHLTSYLEQGDGVPLLLLHDASPGVSAPLTWRHLLPDLTKCARVIAPDLAGFGETEYKSDSVYDLALWVEHAIGVLDALDIARARVVGIGLGGSIAIELAKRYQQRVSHIALLSTPAGEFTQSKAAFALHDRCLALEGLAQALGQLRFMNASLDEADVLSRFETSLKSRVQPHQTQAPTATEGLGRSALVRAHTCLDLYDVSQPTLIVHGREDRLIPLQCGLLLSRSIPNAQFHMFGHCGHWVHLDRPQETVRLIQDFCTWSQLN